MWGQIAAFAAPKVLNFLKGKAQDKVMGAVNNRLQGGGGGSSFGVDQSGGGGGVNYGSGNARYESSTTMDPNSLAIQQEALNKLRGMGGNLEANLAAAQGDYDLASANATNNAALSGFAQNATRGQFEQNQADANFINTKAGIRNADQAQQLQIAQAMGQIGAQGQGEVKYGRETSNLEKGLGALTTGLGLYNQLSPDQGLLDRLGLTRGEGDDSSMPGGGGQGFNLKTLPRRTEADLTNAMYGNNAMNIADTVSANVAQRSLPRMRTKGFNFMKPRNSLRNPRYS
jgi:hypothetical protein